MPDAWDGTERRASPDLNHLQETITTLIDSNAELSQTIHERNVLVAAQGRDLAEIKDRLPKLVTKDEAEEKEQQVRRLIAYAVIAGVLLAASVAWIRREGQVDQHAARLASIARSYGNCEGINRAFEGVDIGYTYLAALSYANAGDDVERRDRIKLAHDALRAGLNRTDCSGHLEGLSEGDIETVRTEASRTQPTLPLPTPPTLAPR